MIKARGKNFTKASEGANCPAFKRKRGAAPQPPWPGPDVTNATPVGWTRHTIDLDGITPPMMAFLMVSDGSMSLIADPNDPDSGVDEADVINDLGFDWDWVRHTFPGDDGGDRFLAWLRAHCEYVMPF